MVKFIFFSNEKKIINTYQKILNRSHSGVKLDISFVEMDVLQLLEENSKIYDFNVIVSPSNSFCVMSGGIDSVYKKLFPNIESKAVKVKDESKLALSTKGYYVPVGMNIIVNTESKLCKYMIMAPTMFLPRNINGTNNVYLTFYGILTKYYDKKITIACPTLGTGIGGMVFEDSANQILDAINDYQNNNPIL
ncbi:MAG: macro domain containing protein [Edafosvirus sp.]|uniref:Macro domain containing protein n=1 Tax=Edafosvirus sp. TaxID=2487765 RepID=A0A3G4ZXA6_9VIRU|nr:MAG: macro domain containing protein [Edafosvirus sp.]